MKVLIAGGGIGGLTAALCCAHFGHEVTVLERAEELGEVGAGIQIPPNAMKVFRALGLEDAIMQNSFAPEAIETRMGESGRQIFTIPLADYAQTRWGAPYLHIHRADYIAALKTALDQRAPGALQLGVCVENYEQSAEAVMVTLSDGRSLFGDVLIGADGIKSRVREQMIGPDKPIFTGNVAWRVVVPMDKLGEHAPRPTACAWMGRGRHGVTYRLRRGELANFVGVVERDDWTKEGWSEPGDKAEAMADFAGWHPTITRLIEAADPGSLFRWALYAREPLGTWVQGRAALLGDAAHPMLPFLASGAAMAVEDAWALADCLTEAGENVETALQSYELRRHKRASRVQAASRANMGTFHQRGRLGQLATYGPMWLGGRLLPKVVHSRMDWLYGHDESKINLR